MPRLTEANYQSRRIKLTEHIAAANAAYRDAAFRQELGQCDANAVAEAKAAIGQFDDRLTALDAAWERTKAENEAKRLAADRAGREAMVKQVEHRLAERAKAAREIEKAAAALGAGWERYEKAGDALKEDVRPYASVHQNAGKVLHELLTSDFHSPKPAIGAALVDVGVRLSSKDFSAPAFRSNPHQGKLSEVVERLNENVRRLAVEISEAA